MKFNSNVNVLREKSGNISFKLYNPVDKKNKDEIEYK